MVKMKKELIKYEDIYVDIRDVTLLSAEEHEQYRNVIPLVNAYWWLRSPGSCRYFAVAVYLDGLLSNADVQFSFVCVRPAIICESSGINTGDKIVFQQLRWTALNESLLLCDECIGYTPFRAGSYDINANKYEASDVKKFLEKWAEDNIPNYGAKNT